VRATLVAAPSLDGTSLIQVQRTVSSASRRIVAVWPLVVESPSSQRSETKWPLAETLVSLTV
jgi:hypothetical protein